jgi:zinc finger protein
MKLTDIPFFKKIVLMCSYCESCGVKSAEVKSGTGIEEKGLRYTLKITDASDLNRDMLKSDTASFEIPEIDFYMNAGTLGDKFTTVEGLLKDLKDNLFQVSPFSQGDSETQAKAKLMDELLKNIDMIREGERLDVTIILDDPSGNSYLQVRPAGIRNLMK